MNFVRRHDFFRCLSFAGLRRASTLGRQTDSAPSRPHSGRFKARKPHLLTAPYNVNFCPTVVPQPALRFRIPRSPCRPTAGKTGLFLPPERLAGAPRRKKASPPVFRTKPAVFDKARNPFFRIPSRHAPGTKWTAKPSGRRLQTVEPKSTPKKPLSARFAVVNFPSRPIPDAPSSERTKRSPFSCTAHVGRQNVSATKTASCPTACGNRLSGPSPSRPSIVRNGKGEHSFSCPAGTPAGMAGFQQGLSRPQKENDKKPKSGLPRKRSRKAKNRNGHRLTRIGGGRFAAKSSRSPRDESLVASFRRTDRYGQKPHTETRQSAPGHAVPLPAGNAPKIGPHRAVRNSHPPHSPPSRSPERGNTKGHPKIRMPFRGKWGIRTPGTGNPVRQFSKLLVSATHPTFLP